jgi:hypothetical protein
MFTVKKVTPVIKTKFMITGATIMALLKVIALIAGHI